MSYKVRRRPLRVKKFSREYFPVTYEQLAVMTGQSLDELKRSEETLISSGFINVIKRGNVIYVKLNKDFASD